MDVLQKETGDWLENRESLLFNCYIANPICVIVCYLLPKGLFKDNYRLVVKDIY